MCMDGCHLRTLVVGTKALHRIKRSQCIIGRSPPWASREENLRKIGVSSDSLITWYMIVIMHNITCIYILGKIID